MVRVPLRIAAQGHIFYKCISGWLDSAARVFFLDLKAPEITTDFYRTQIQLNSCNDVSNTNETWYYSSGVRFMHYTPKVSLMIVQCKMYAVMCHLQVVVIVMRVIFSENTVL